MSTTAIATAILVDSADGLLDGMKNLGKLQSKLAQINLAEAKRIAKAKAAVAADKQALVAAIDSQRDSIATYVVKNRGSILGESIRTVTEAGEIAIEALPAATDVQKGDEEGVIKRLMKRFGDRYVQTTRTLKKGDLLKDRIRVKGLTIKTGREKIVLTPITSGEKITKEI